jgi:hypothetical protein
MLGTEEAADLPDSYYVVAAIRTSWRIKIMMEFIEGSVGQLDLTY